MTKQWKWKHYNVESISTKELKEFYTNPSYKRKKEVIRLELVKRNGIWKFIKQLGYGSKMAIECRQESKEKKIWNLKSF